MIDLKDLPEDTKFMNDDATMWDCKQSMLEEQSYERSDVYLAVPSKQEITRSDIEDIFVNIEENSGYEGQASDCMDSLSEEDEKTILDILNKIMQAHPSYETGGMIGCKSIDQALLEVQE